MTLKQEQKIYDTVMEVFESNKGECTNCESHFVTDEYNYFLMHNGEKEFKVSFKISNGKLLKKSITIK